MLLPYRVKNPPDTFPFVTLALIAINVVALIATSDGVAINDDILKQWAFSGGICPLQRQRGVLHPD